MSKLLKKTIFLIQVATEKMAKPEASQTFGISLEKLKGVVSDKHRNEIAKKVGGDWESLATFIGVSSEEVDDIKEEYRKPMD